MPAARDARVKDPSLHAHVHTHGARQSSRLSLPTLRPREIFRSARPLASLSRDELRYRMRRFSRVGVSRSGFASTPCRNATIRDTELG